MIARAQRLPPSTHWAPSVYLDNRNPFAAAAAVRVIGLNLGVVPPGKAYRVGLSAYTLRRNYAEQRQRGGPVPSLNLRYLTPSFTYLLVRQRFFEVSLPVDVGLGSSHYVTTDAQGQLLADTHDLFVPADAGLGLLLKPTRWVGVSGGVGYRLSLTREEFEDGFNGWYYCYRLNLFVGTIWADLHHRNQPAKQPPE